MKKDIESTIKDMKEFTKEICGDPEKAKQFLINAGIYDEDGNLTEHYQSDIKIENDFKWMKEFHES